MVLLSAENLTRRFGERVAVDRLSFALERGEALGVLGPNGAGKSTTFALLTGMLASHGGRVIFDGKEVSPTEGAFRARIGVVFQKPSLDEKLTGLENMKLGAAMYGIPPRTAQPRIEKLLAMVELGDRANETVDRYSGGMKRRLELARVFLHEPELLILDEPTTGLDIAASRRIWAKLLELKRESRTALLLTTHDPEEAALCDRIVIIDHGQVIAEGTPSELAARVGGEVISLEADDADFAIETLRERLGIDARILEGKVVFERPHAHELIPRVVEALPGRLRSINMRPPTLGDVFVKLTGRSLAQEAPKEESA